MKTTLYLYISWSVLSTGLLFGAADTYESPFPTRKLGTPESKQTKLSRTLDTPGIASASSEPGSQEPDPPPAPLRPRAVRSGDIRSDFAHLPDVSVTCSTSDFVVRVKPAFYGLGADAEELTLGSACRSNGVLAPYGDLLFTYPLTACDAVRRSPRDYLLYKFVLHYEPSPKRVVGRAHRIDVDIQCRYPRNHHVHQLTVQPTWKTAVVRKRLKGSASGFQIDLMDDSWSRPAESKLYQLGNKMNFQVSALQLSPGEKLYINSCYAIPSSDSKSPLKYTIIEDYGCLLDSQRYPGASEYISRTDKTLRFSLKAFQFTSQPDLEVSVHCKLLVTSERPGPALKSCTYRGSRWEALYGDNSICECCDSQCVTSKPRRAMVEGSASSESLLVSDQPHMAEDGFLPVSPISISMNREGDAPVIHHTEEVHSNGNQRGSAHVMIYDDDDEEEPLEGVNSGVMTELDLEELLVRERDFVEVNKSSVMASNQFEEDASGHLMLEDYSESEGKVFEGRENGIAHVQQVIHLNQKEVVPLEVGPWRELQPQVSEEENGKHTGKGEEDDRMMVSEVQGNNHEGDLVDDGMKTWYFWR